MGLGAPGRTRPGPLSSLQQATYSFLGPRADISIHATECSSVAYIL